MLEYLADSSIAGFLRRYLYPPGTFTAKLSLVSGCLRAAGPDEAMEVADGSDAVDKLYFWYAGADEDKIMNVNELMNTIKNGTSGSP